MMLGKRGIQIFLWAAQASSKVGIPNAGAGSLNLNISYYTDEVLVWFRSLEDSLCHAAFTDI